MKPKFCKYCDAWSPARLIHGEVYHRPLAHEPGCPVAKTFELATPDAPVDDRDQHGDPPEADWPENAPPFTVEEASNLALEVRISELQALKEYADELDPEIAIFFERYLFMRRAMILAMVTHRPD